MKLTNVTAINYKGLRYASSPISDFVCVIGRNNAGKSSLLQALLLFINGPKLTKTDFYDPDTEILITVSLSGVSEELLQKLTDEQRAKLAPFVKDECLVLARRYATDGSSKLRLVTNVPKDKRYHDEQVENAFKQKKGKEIEQILLSDYPETCDAISAAAATTQKAAKELIQGYVGKLLPAELVMADIPLPTGIDNSIRSILPEPVYIPAVKDLSDDLKTKESASFGKLLNILLDVIKGDLSDAADTFENLKKKLNRLVHEDGTVIDDRMPKVKAIEETIQRNLQETFRNVAIELQIPPPEVKAILSNATIIADDGHRGPAESKGDGFKRAITFSILRSYVELSQSKDWRSEVEKEKPTRDSFLFLFEEPELYLHPNAQSILFDALSLISKSHQVVVTTHSPMFFSPNSIGTFVKISKRWPAAPEKPYGECLPIDLTDLSEKDKFQIIAFETSNFAFFSDKIVLVEGDSELIVFPHIASLLNAHWNFKAGSTSLIKINGKGNFKRYREFFSRFGVEVDLVADLDILLQDFDKVTPTALAMQLRDDLLQAVDQIIVEANKLEMPPHGLLHEELQRDRAKALYTKLLEARKNKDIPAQGEVLDDIFVFERTKPRLEVIRDHSRKAILDKKRALLSELRSSGVFVLEKGAIESYYPAGLAGPDKPSKAQSFCSSVTTAVEANKFCEAMNHEGKLISEFEIVFGDIFKR